MAITLGGTHLCLAAISPAISAAVIVKKVGGTARVALCDAVN